MPVTLQNVKLCAILEDGYKIYGESKISSHNTYHYGRISELKLIPETVLPCEEDIEAIKEADLIVIGPGSLYTSIIPNLIVKNISSEIISSKAIKIYICNLMAQPGETDKYTVYDHIYELTKHSGRGIIDYCIVNNGDIPDDLKEKYIKQGAQMIIVDYDKINKAGIKIIEDDFIDIKEGVIRHKASLIAKTLLKLLPKEKE